MKCKREALQWNISYLGKIQPKDVNESAIALGGTLINVHRHNKKIAFELIDEDTKLVETIYTSPDYFVQKIEGLDTRLKLLEQIIENGQKPQAAFFVSVSPTENGLICYLYQENHIRILHNARILKLTEYIGYYNKLI
ncbi:hypothetical protein MOO45_00655 [Bombilactobacillus folatiphilus]|uniref:Uncharacterized protein n=1 Tax=Bombilactobacillus folatiphilus TaxID=2923362 RepID=A0ABY4P9D6_9LACO|nr:hypothetical protein [Bombilactobacillus folatiphilus]UQS82237.1 hypothetical protein MOO45_00655 [Bombilactobacillus folatiphilus]